MERDWESMTKFLKQVGLHVDVASSKGKLIPPFIQEFQVLFGYMYQLR